MRPSICLLSIAIAGSLSGQAVEGQAVEARLVSGPPAGTLLTKVEVHAASGPHAGTTFDAAATLARAPCALLFVHELTRNTAPMIRALDRLGTEYGLLGFRSFTVMLADDRTAAEKQIERSSTSLGMRNPLVVSVDGSDGPGGYGLNRKCTLTLLLGNGGRVTRAVGFTDTGPQDVAPLETWIAELTGPLPKDPAGWRQLLGKRFPASDSELLDLTSGLLVQVRKLEQDGPRMRGRPERDAAAPASAVPTTAKPREGKAPDDAELRTLLRAVIQKTASEADLDEVFRQVDARVGDDAALKLQAVEMFKLVLSLGYGTDAAQTRAKIYLAAHSTPADGKK